MLGMLSWSYFGTRERFLALQGPKNTINDMQTGYFGPREWSRREKGPRISDFLDLLLYRKGVKVQNDILMLDGQRIFGHGY